MPVPGVGPRPPTPACTATRPLARYRERYLQLTERRLATPAFPVVPTGPEAERPLGSLLARARAVERRAAARPGDDPGGIPEAIEAVGA